MTKITQSVVACTSEYVPFDPMKPEETTLDWFQYFPTDHFDEAGRLLPEHQSTVMSYSAVGSATITVEFYTGKQMLEAKVQALKAQKIQIQADAQAALNNLEQKIQNLLALSYDKDQS